jgi:thiol-disulfide isomerase/thioredoxin
MLMKMYNRNFWTVASLSLLLVGTVIVAKQASASDQFPDPVSATAQWLNSPPLTSEDLRGKVVLVEFWTYDCINCQHTLPYVKAW